eukprot:gnl/Dysnectes_brevis/829_a914_2898.p1 GENE.gnl/Dysnectes_brevis/829_a914_2898~~gnl/Dysnectes_brevis/829_a914_2898.p1  ORF type:complete len:427 (-),score=113.92 gnl/Dysnectes_brevis/829_a914_2898:35-1294(-)
MSGAKDSSGQYDYFDAINIDALLECFDVSEPSSTLEESGSHTDATHSIATSINSLRTERAEVRTTTSFPSRPGGRFGCQICQLQFESREEQVAHYKSDDHITTLRSHFDGMLGANDDDDMESWGRKGKHTRGKEEDHFFCSDCSKSFRTEAQYSHHVSSKKHQKRVMRNPAPSSDTQMQSPVQAIQAAEKTTFDRLAREYSHLNDKDFSQLIFKEIISKRPALSSNSCLFCSHEEESMPGLLRHMQSEHSFFVRFRSCVTDLPGLLDHMRVVVGKWYACLQCSHVFGTLKACRAHMDNLSHTSYPFSPVEMRPFYDIEAVEHLAGEVDAAMKLVLDAKRKAAEDRRRGIFPQGVSASTSVEEGPETRITRVINPEFMSLPGYLRQELVLSVKAKKEGDRTLRKRATKQHRSYRRSRLLL